MVKLIPLVQDIEAWKHHFREMAKGNRHGQTVIKGSGTKRHKDTVIKMVTPTTQAVERAKALLNIDNNQSKKRKAFIEEKNKKKKKRLL